MWYELGLMRVRLGHIVQAIDALEIFVAHSRCPTSLRRARTLLERLRAPLN